MYRVSGYELKLVKPKTRLEVRKYFSNRVVDEWNHSPEEIIQWRTVSNSKKKLDDHLNNIMGIYLSLYNTSYLGFFLLASKVRDLPVLLLIHLTQAVRTRRPCTRNQNYGHGGNNYRSVYVYA